MNKKIELFQTLTKTKLNDYLAVLSDNSVDRDGEIVGPEAFNKMLSTQREDRVPILLNHENNIENMIGEWMERKIVERNGHTALTAKPKFFLSNPKAKMIKGMLDDGAQCGISIGAIVKDSKKMKINNVDTTVYTDLELLEASFVAIPSNRHGAAVAVAKMFKEEQKMDEETKTYSEEEFNELKKVNEVLKAELEELKKEEVPQEPPKEEEVEPEKEEPEKEEVVVDEEKEEQKQRIVELEKKVEELSKRPVFKAKDTTEESNKQVAKEKELPVIRR